MQRCRKASMLPCGATSTLCRGASPRATPWEFQHPFGATPLVGSPLVGVPLPFMCDIMTQFSLQQHFAARGGIDAMSHPSTYFNIEYRA